MKTLLPLFLVACATNPDIGEPQPNHPSIVTSTPQGNTTPDIACPTSEQTCLCEPGEACVELAVEQEKLTTCVKTCSTSADCAAGVACVTTSAVFFADANAGGPLYFCDAPTSDSALPLEIRDCGWWSANTPPAFSCGAASATCVDDHTLSSSYAREDELWCGTQRTACTHGCVTDTTGAHCA